MNHVNDGYTAAIFPHINNLRCADMITSPVSKFHKDYQELNRHQVQDKKHHFPNRLHVNQTDTPPAETQPRCFSATLHACLCYLQSSGPLCMAKDLLAMLIGRLRVWKCVNLMERETVPNPLDPGLPTDLSQSLRLSNTLMMISKTKLSTEKTYTTTLGSDSKNESESTEGSGTLATRDPEWPTK